MKRGLLLFLASFAFSLGASDTLDLFELDIDALHQITVEVATKQKKSLSSVPATVRVVTAKMIKQRGYLTLEDILTDLPGFGFRNINGFNSYSFMRGVVSQNNLILVMVDGVQINELNSGGFYGGLQYNLFNVKQIEVLYGPSSALYGTNALSGIINIITYSPKEKDAGGNEVVLGGGEHNTGYGAFRSGAYDTRRELGYTLSGHYVTSEKAELGGVEGDYNWGEGMENFEESFSLEGKLSYKAFDFGAVVQNKRASRTTNDKATGTEKRDYGTLWNITFINLWLRHEASLDATKKFISKLYYRNSTVQDDTIAYINETPLPGQQVGYYRPNWLAGLDEQLLYTPLDGLSLTTGVTVEYEKLAEGFSKSYSQSSDTEPDAPSSPSMLSNHLVSLYAQVQYYPTDWLEVTAGARYDNSSYYDDVLTPRLAFVYKYGEGVLKLLYSEAFRAPKPWDYNDGVGNSSLKPEKVKSYEIAASYQLNRFLLIEGSLFYNTIKDKLTQQNSPQKWVNIGKLKSRGAEMSLRYSIGEFDGYANYTYVNSEDENGIKSDEIAEHTLNGGADYRFDRHWLVDLRGNYVSGKTNPALVPATQRYRIDPYLVVNAQLSYRDLFGADIYLSVNNLFDETYYHTSNRTVSRYRQPQRTVLLRVAYAF